MPQIVSKLLFKSKRSFLKASLLLIYIIATSSQSSLEHSSSKVLILLTIWNNTNFNLILYQYLNKSKKNLSNDNIKYIFKIIIL